MVFVAQVCAGGQLRYLVRNWATTGDTAAARWPRPHPRRRRRPRTSIYHGSRVPNARRKPRLAGAQALRNPRRPGAWRPM